MTLHEITTGLVIVGSGAAGLMAACVAGEVTSDIVLVTDGGLGRSNSVMAQGGLHVPVDTPEGRRRMLSDMVAAGGPTINQALATRFIDEILPTVDLLQDWGLELDTDADGEIVRRRAGAMSEARIVGTGDRIGPSVIRVLRTRLDQTGVAVMTRTSVTGLIPTETGLTVELSRGGRILASAVIIATGGDAHHHAASVGEPCTNPSNRNFEMSEILAGLAIPRVDDGMYQWQPFGLLEVTSGATRQCAPESVVAHGVRILDRHGAEVVAADAGRAVVTSAMKEAISNGRGVRSSTGETGLWLTLSDLPDQILRSQYGHLAASLDRHGMAGSDLLIGPYLHYQLGGFLMSEDCSCVISGLYLAGEVAGGLHGHGRLMGNGLTDSLVHGRRAAVYAVDRLGDPPQAPASSAGSGQ